MTPEEFRKMGHRLIDWIADYRQTIEERPVRSQVKPGFVRQALDGPVPEATPRDKNAELDAIISDLDRVITPALSHFQHPRYFAYFPANASLAAVLGDIVSTGLGVVGLNWEAAPALTELETLTCHWYRALFGLDEGWQGSIHDTASTGTLVALLCARERTSEGARKREGLARVDAPRVVYASEQAHSSVEKATLLAGFGKEHLRRVPCNPDFALNLGALMDRDRAEGLVPAAVVATVGSTGVAAIDSITPIVAHATRHGAWVHVDAALAGAAAILPEYRWIFAGIEGADSVCINAHKWLGTVFDCSLLYVRDVAHLVRCMSTDPSYLRSRGEDVRQYRNWGIPLGRRFRALKMWFHLRLEGAQSLRARLRRDIDNARWLQAQVETEPGWRVVAPVHLQTVCVRHEPAGLTEDALDAHTLAWIADINNSGAAYLTAARLEGRWMVRVSVGAEPTERGHVEALWARMKAAVGTVGPV